MQNQQEKEEKLHRQRKRLEMMENNPFFHFTTRKQ